MRTTLAVILIALYVSVGHAQSNKIEFGFAAATNINPFLVSTESNAPEVTLGFSTGLMARKSFSDHLTLDVGTYFTKISYHGEYLTDVVFGPDDPVFTSGRYSFSYTYIDVPVELNFQFGGRSDVKWVASGGIVNSFGISNDFESLKGNGGYLTNVKAGFGAMVYGEKLIFGLEPQLRYALLQDLKYADSDNLYVGVEAYILLHRNR